LIRVVDNGVGMDGDDVLLCLERHATSKLTDESQLAAIATLGFRGEALPSIGSVSRMTILSRTRDAVVGTRADIRYGTLHGVHEDGCARGTLIEVRNLFGNLPARRKFLKTNRTELSHIDEVIRSQSLAHPGVAFSLQVDGRTMFDFPAADLERRVRDVFRYSEALLPVAFKGAEEQLDLQGFLLLPDMVPSAKLRILVNARPVQDRMIRHAVMEGLQGFLMKGVQPAGALLLSLSAELVDVNVHPAKREIRFRNSREVHRFMVGAVAQAVRSHQEAVRSALFRVPDQGQPPADPVPPQSSSADSPGPEAAAPVQQSVSMEPGSAASQAQEPVFVHSAPPEKQVRFDPPAPVPPQAAVGPLTLIGQLNNLYLLCERDGQLVVIDQHAAHERILFQQLREAYVNCEVPCQSLLFPVTVELGPDHAATLEQEADAVASLGVQADFFGDSTWVIKGVPALVGRLDPREILMDILDGLAGASDSALPGVVPEHIDNLLASMACKAAIKAGNRLQPEEMVNLLQQMEQSEVFSHCPHGRPVIKTFSPREIEGWFHRT
jgi:DNA mismatch repair protein MutL